MTHSQIVTMLTDTRKKIGATSRWLGDRIGYDHCGLLKWEKGKNSPSLRAAIDWADALGFEIVLLEKRANKFPLRAGPRGIR